MARIDFPTTSNVHPLYAPSAPMSTESAGLYVRRNKGLASILVLSRNGESIVFTRTQGWSKHDGEAMARRHGYDLFGWVNIDGKHGAGVITGRDVYVPVNRRVLAAVS